MAEMLVKSESLTSIADKIRVLSGTDNAMGLDDMANHVGEANTDVATEAGLIAQITTALEGKAAGGNGGSGGGGVETCTVTINILDEPRTFPFYCILTVIENGEISSVVVNKSSEFSNVIKNSKVYYMYPEDGAVFISTSDGHTDFQFIYMFSESGMGIGLNNFILTASTIIEVE